MTGEDPTNISVGYNQVPHWLTRDSNLSRNELWVFIALSDRSDMNGYAYPSVRLIASDSRLSERTVQTTIPALVKLGLVEKTTRPRANGTNQSNRYRVAKLPHDGTCGKWQHLIRGVQGLHPRVQGLHQGGAPVAGEVEPLEEEPLEEESRSDLTAGRDHSFSSSDSDVWPTPPATQKQLTYLHELFIQFTGVIPNARTKGEWAVLDIEQAKRLIQDYHRNMNRGDDFQGPEEGEPAFDALSDKGKAYAEAGMLPGLVPAEFWTEAIA